MEAAGKGLLLSCLSELIIFQSLNLKLRSIIDADSRQVLTYHCPRAVSLGKAAFADLQSAEDRAIIVNNHEWAQQLQSRRNEIGALLQTLTDMMSTETAEFSFTSVSSVLLYEGRAGPSPDRGDQDPSLSVACCIFRSRNVALVRAMLLAVQPDLELPALTKLSAQSLMNRSLLATFACMHEHQADWMKAIILAGFTSAELRAASVSAGLLKTAGFSLCDLMEAGFNLLELHDAGCAAAELKAAGFELSSLLAAGYSVSEMKSIGFLASRLKDAGCSAQQLKDSDFTAAELKVAGFDVISLLGAGYSVPELKGAGFTALELSDCVRADDLKDGGFSAAELKGIGFTSAELKAAGFELSSLLAAGFSILEMKSIGFPASRLKDAGCSAQQLKDSDFTAAELKMAGFDVISLLGAGYSVPELKGAGFTAGNLKRAGCAAIALKDAGFHAVAVKVAFGLDLSSLMSLGYSNAASFKVAGVKPQDLIVTGHPEVTVVSCNVRAILCFCVCCRARSNLFALQLACYMFLKCHSGALLYIWTLTDRSASATTATSTHPSTHTPSTTAPTLEMVTSWYQCPLVSRWRPETSMTSVCARRTRGRVRGLPLPTAESAALQYAEGQSSSVTNLLICVADLRRQVANSYCLELTLFVLQVAYKT